MISSGITKGASLVIADLLDVCCEIKPGDEVLIASHVDGLQGGDNLVDEQTVAWIQQGVMARGANPTVMWFEEPAKKHNWRVPPVFLGAMRAADVVIKNTTDLTTEEMRIIHEMAREYNVRLCRNFVTTVGLLNSPWAQTPYELVTEIRHEAAKPFDESDAQFILEDPNGTYIEGKILPTNGYMHSKYSDYRKQGNSFLPFPEWMFPPISITNTNGVFVFNQMMSWWSRYIGIPPVFEHPIELTIKDSKITKISGDNEADTLRRFFKEEMEPILGQDVYNIPAIHSGVHPCAVVGPQHCDHPLITRLVGHTEHCNIHLHLGAPQPCEAYPYWFHVTGDIRNATWKVGEHLVHDKGRLTAIDLPCIKAIAEKYPDRPGLGFVPRSF